MTEGTNFIVTRYAVTPEGIRSVRVDQNPYKRKPNGEMPLLGFVPLCGSRLERKRLLSLLRARKTEMLTLKEQRAVTHFCPRNPCPTCDQPWPPIESIPMPMWIEPTPESMPWLSSPSCACPSEWWGTFPPPCPIHNPQRSTIVVDFTISCRRATIPGDP